MARGRAVVHRRANSAHVSPALGAPGCVLVLDVAFVMALAVFGNMALATLAGAGIPILLRSWGFDPALASNIFLTFVTDMVGFAGFLLIATLLL